MRVVFVMDDFLIEPLGIGYLSSVLKEEGHKVDLVKTNGDITVPKEMRDLHDEKFILAYSVTTGTHQYYIKLNNLLKTYFQNAIAVFGGPHPTYFPEVLEERCIDYIIRGEAEKALPELLSCIEDGREFNCGEVCDLVQDLDTIPFPDRDLLYKYDRNRDNPIKSVMTMRGCPFSCTYCYNVLYKQLYREKKQKLVRFRGARNIIDECKDLKRFPLEMIYFQDDEFTSNPNFTALMLMYKDEVQVPFHAQLRIDRITEEKIILLKDAGCTGVTFAIESGSERLRKELLNRHMSNEKILAGVALLKKHKMKFRTENMIGAPTETRKDILDTIRLNIACKPAVAWASIFQPYPNLELGKKCEELGLWECNVDDFSPNFFDKTELKFEPRHARFVNNTQKFFGFISKHKWALPLALLLSHIPENEKFKEFYAWYKQRGYNLLYSNKEGKCQAKKILEKRPSKVSVTKASVRRFFHQS